MNACIVFAWAVEDGPHFIKSKDIDRVRAFRSYKKTVFLQTAWYQCYDRTALVLEIE
jgi:hypothetical protein